MFVTLTLRNESGAFYDEEGDYHQGMVLPDGTRINRGQGFNYKGEYLGFYILYPDECNSFDIMAIDEEGDSYFIWDYEICDGYEEELEITLDDWDDEFELDLEEVTIINDTGYDIWYIFISPSDSDMWGIDHLDDETILYDGDSVEFLAPAGASFDVMLVDEDEDTYSKYNTELSGKLIIDISDYDD